jgi:DNA-binding MarR family transcriptional regulator
VSKPDADTIRDLVQMVIAAATAPIRTMAVAEVLRGDGIHQSDIYRALATLERRGAIERRRDLMENRGRAQVVWQMAPVDLDQLQEA